MASGFLENSENVTLTGVGGGAIDTNNYVKATLTASTTESSGIGLPTGMVRWSHLELIIEDDTANQVDRLARVFLTWDTEGNDICAGPSSKAGASMIARRDTTTDYYMTVIDLDFVASLPTSDGVANTIYVWITTGGFNISNPILHRARLHWYELSKG